MADPGAAPAGDEDRGTGLLAHVASLLELLATIEKRRGDDPTDVSADFVKQVRAAGPRVPPCDCCWHTTSPHTARATMHFAASHVRTAHGFMTSTHAHEHTL